VTVFTGQEGEEARWLHGAEGGRHIEEWRGSQEGRWQRLASRG
jgi:hypothetical protein